MGLSIVLGIVKSHRGIIQVDSELGEGATFTIYFPILEDVKKEGGTDYLIVPFPTDPTDEQPWISFVTKRAEGFSKLEINRNRRNPGPKPSNHPQPAFASTQHPAK